MAESMMSVNGNAKMRIDAHALPPHPIACFAKGKKLLTHLQTRHVLYLYGISSKRTMFCYVPLQCIRALA
jgi:hypothetical protein